MSLLTITIFANKNKKKEKEKKSDKSGWGMMKRIYSLLLRCLSKKREEKICYLYLYMEVLKNMRIKNRCRLMIDNFHFLPPQSRRSYNKSARHKKLESWHQS